MAVRAFVFPGQGSQAVGMSLDVARAFPEAAAVFESADQALGFELSRLCRQGPEEELMLTANTQPAILTASIAILRVLESRGYRPAVVAGHSLGEYSALVAASCLEFEDAVRLVRRRGELMQEAVPVGAGAMAAILGLEDSLVDEVVAGVADGVCAIANLNAPGQVVIAGDRRAVEAAVEGAQARGARRALLLPVSAPFHSPLMRPAREGMEPHLRAASFADPVVPVVTNVDAAAVSTGAEVRDALIRQIDQPVRWVESVVGIVRGFAVDGFLEVGPGRVLSGLIRRIEKSVKSVPLADLGALTGFLSADH